MSNTFIWADLSTFNMAQAKDFYQQCFDWSYIPLDEDYTVCESQQVAVAGLYPMPEPFQQINMPSFWMSYIQVDDIEYIVKQAKQHGAIVEVKPQTGPGGGRIALIRDPSGAGFTCYEGDAINSPTISRAGHRVWHELHVSDLNGVKRFYEQVFGWIFKAAKESDRWLVFTAQDSVNPIAGVQVTANELKGDKEYWGVYFLVDNLTDTARCIEKAGGEVLVEQSLGESPALLAFDSQGAAFYVMSNARATHNIESTSAKATFKWRALTGLLIIMLAIVLEANWLWGLFFLLWLMPDLKSGRTHFMEQVGRQHNPVVYWLIMGTWISLAAYLLFEPFVVR